MPVSVVIVQPPLAQLNGPYPSGAYLAAFFRRLAADGLSAPDSVRWIDSGNDFFLDLFSASGLSRLFALCRDAALAKADAASRSGDSETAFQLRRYVSLERAWVSWIDGIVSILRTGDRELAHSFVRSPSAPRGARMDVFLSNLGGEPTADDARLLATLALEDLADFIVATFDPAFSLIRYAESVAAGVRNFSAVEAALSAPIVAEFIEPLFERTWLSLDASISPDDTLLFCVSVPFPGCLVAALACARSVRRHYGARAVISMGGGYVNTELRSCENPRLFSYVDILSFDRGYGGYAALMRELSVGFQADAGGDRVGGGGPAPGDALRAAGISNRLFCPDEFAAYEKSVTMTLSPDYSDIDFSRYPRLADDPNPMHRLWSDGTWLKAYLAHGCYWHRCSFCDVSLDYIAVYLPVGIEKLYRDLRWQAIDKRVHGIHLVDEAAPPRALRDFALENLRSSRAITAGEPSLIPFWGNIRFEKTFTRDLADFLAAGGLVAVSGGIEIASEEGFKAVGKGIDLDNLVATCAAFKEAGVLVHSYLIYGYWDETAQDVIDSAETMRQLFACGLVDSAFWHKFTLTRHSRVFCERASGMHSGLEPTAAPGDFAENTLSFKGERDSERYSAPLATALDSWMSGENLDRPIRSWFPYAMPAPRVAKNLIDACIAKYERARDAARDAACDPEARYYWAGSEPLCVGPANVTSVSGKGELVWWYLGEEVRLPSTREVADSVHRALCPMVLGDDVACDSAVLCELPREIFTALRHHGLCLISPLS